MMTTQTSHATERDPQAAAARVALGGTRTERFSLGARALRELLRNPDDTMQVFLLGMVANYGSFPQYLLRIAASEDGDRLLSERPSIDGTHVDWNAMRALPADTLGGAYARYLDDNGLDPDLFQAPPGLPPLIAYIAKRTRQTHDIWHVLTGYSPDVAGEVALQAFTYAQTRMLSSALIASAGTLRFAPKAPGMLPMTLDGLRRGRKAAFLPTVRWEEHWTRKLEDVRRELGITPARAKTVKLKAKDAVS